MRFVSDRERVINRTCPASRQPIHFRFRRRPFRTPLARLKCPACGLDHAELAAGLAASNGLDGWSIELHGGHGPEGYEVAASYTL